MSLEESIDKAFVQRVYDRQKAFEQSILHPIRILDLPPATQALVDALIVSRWDMTEEDAYKDLKLRDKVMNPTLGWIYQMYRCR